MGFLQHVFLSSHVPPSGQTSAALMLRRARNRIDICRAWIQDRGVQSQSGSTRSSSPNWKNLLPPRREKSSRHYREQNRNKRRCRSGLQTFQLIKSDRLCCCSADRISKLIDFSHKVRMRSTKAHPLIAASAAKTDGIWLKRRTEWF